MAILQRTRSLSSVLIGLLLMAAAVTVQAQETRSVSGRVELSADGAPIADALVFAARTTISTTTDNDGQFTLTTPPQAAFDLTVVAPGFELYSVRIQELGEPLTIRLEPAADATTDAEMPPPDEDLLSVLDDALFLSCGKCQFVNPEVLTINRMEGSERIVAVANAPFVYENPDLGYRVTWYGFRFTGDPVTPGWEGAALFSDMEGSEKDMKKWGKKRNEAYEGTLRHFLRAIVEERVEKEYFAAYHVQFASSTDVRTPIAEMGRKGFGYDTIRPIGREGHAPGLRKLMFSGWLYVTSRENNGAEPGRGQLETYWPVEIRNILQGGSWIQLPFAEANFDESGVLLDGQFSERVQTLGLMSYNRWNTLLPNDWMPED